MILDLQLSLRILHVGDRTHGCQGYLCHDCHGCLYCTHYGKNCVTRKLLQKEERLLQVFLALELKNCCLFSRYFHLFCCMDFQC